MAYTAQEPLDEARVLLNDPSGLLYTDAKLIPIIQKAYRELQQKLIINGVPTLREQSTIIDVAAGTTELTDGAGLPSDFVSPISLEERTDGSTDLFIPMDELDWEPNADQTSDLRFWNFREEAIKFLGATTNREVKLKYWKGLTRITSSATGISVIGATSFLASRTAAIAAWVLGENSTKAASLNSDATVQLDDLLKMQVNRMQGLPIRRRVNRYRR